MKLFILALAIAATSAFKYTTEWEMWKREHGKDYTYEEEEMMRHTIFESNKDYVDNHNANADRWGFTLALNEFADLDSAEFAQLYNGYQESMRPPSNKTYEFKGSVSDCPATVDWSKQGYVTPVKNQGQCGSCWAFSTTGSMEGQYFKKTGKLVSFSEQQLVDCSKKYGNHGCEGGLMDQAFKYIKDEGIEREEDYPYKAEDGTCHYSSSDVVTHCTGYVDIPTKNCADLQKAICDIGPISVAMDASHTSFQLYHSGIYDPWLLGCSSTRLDHGVLAVGYGTQDEKAYFLVKNSWGTTWGMKGYFMILNKNDKCGICTQASYPVL